MRFRIMGVLHLLLFSMAATAHAQGGVNLRWSDCASGIGFTHASFACATNTGTHTVVASFVPPPGVTALGRTAIALRICAETPSYPAWWELFNPGSCRPSSLVWTSPGGVSCLNPWEGAPVAGSIISVGPGLGTADRLVYADSHTADGSGHAVDPTLEYEAVRLVIDHDHTVGTGACAGCIAPVWLVLEQVDLFMTDGSPPIHLTMPVQGLYATWQSTIYTWPPCLIPTPARNRTWGEIKSLYR